MSISVNLLKLGRLSYRSGLKLQDSICKLHLTGEESSNTLLLLEHNPVYTIGIRSSNYSKSDEERLKKLGADFYQTNRGGLITYHGPGQLIIYPILNLKDFKLTMRSYIANLEKTVVNVCKKLNLEAYTCEHTGVWINGRKVCAIGVHGSRYITSHGLALNCTVDVLKWFEHIVPCGLEGKGVTSLSKEMKINYNVDEAVSLFLESFCDIFNCSFADLSKEKAESILNKVHPNWISDEKTNCLMP